MGGTLTRRVTNFVETAILLAYVLISVNLLWSTLAILYLILPRKQYAHLSKKFVHYFLILFVWFYERRTGYRTVLTGDLADIKKKESAFLIINHPGQDWAPLYSMALRMDMLGYVMPIVKSSIRMIPGFGWAMHLAGSLFLTRKWEKDRKYLKHMMGMLREDKVPFHLWLFAEGHRFTKKHYEAGVKFAKSRNLKPYKHLLVPRTKGFIQLKQCLNGACDYIYDITVAYSGMKPHVKAILLPSSRVTNERGPHVHVRRIPLSKLPKDEDEKALDMWLKDLYHEKDELLSYFEKHGKFPSKEVTYQNLTFSDCLPAVAVWSSIGTFWIAIAMGLVGSSSSFGLGLFF